MLVFEAMNEIRGRLELKEEYKKQISEYLEALEMAYKALEAQTRLADILNDFYAEDEEKQGRYVFKIVMPGASRMLQI